MMLKRKGATHAVSLAANDNKWGTEADNLKVVGELIRVPDLAVLCFQCFSTSGLGVDLDDNLPADLFGGVSHGRSLCN